MDFIIFIVQICTLVILTGISLLFVYFQYSYTYWKRKGVPYLRPRFPLGNAKHFILETSNYTTITQDWYFDLKKQGAKFGGVWDICRPVLIVLDPNYIRDILTKDFQYFVNRDFYHNDNDPVPANLFLSKSDRWKNTRQKLTPIFTSGKMKVMFDNMVRCSESMVEFLEEQATTGTEVHVKHVMASFTIDVIGCCIFGLDVNSFKNPNDKFRNIALRIFKRSPTSIYFNYPLIRMFGNFCMQFGIKGNALGKTEDVEFFENLLKNTIDYRKKNNVHRPDFIQLMVDLNEHSADTEKPFDFETMVANTMLFFIAGFDTSSTTMNFALYELARNPDVQEKARQEILRVLDQKNSKLSYEAIGEMTYLRQVIDETLRLYPAVPIVARVCIKDYKLGDTNTVIEKGTSVVIPPLGLGYDPEHFPEPQKFDPDRFSIKNKADRNPYVFLGFGEGPRNCIGSRFGLMQSSIGIIQILRNFKVVTSPSTKELTLDDKGFLLKSKETLYLKFERI